MLKRRFGEFKKQLGLFLEAADLSLDNIVQQVPDVFMAQAIQDRGAARGSSSVSQNSQPGLQASTAGMMSETFSQLHRFERKTLDLLSGQGQFELAIESAALLYQSRIVGRNYFKNMRLMRL